MSAVEGVSTAMGETPAPEIREVAEALTGTAGEVTSFVENNRALLVSIVKGVALFGAVGAAILGVGAAIMFAGGVLSGLGTLIGAAFGVFSFLAATITAVGGIVFSWGGLVIGVVGAVAAAFVYFSGAGSAAAGLVGRQFAALRATFNESFGGILDALKRGDMSAAGEIAVAGLKVAFFGLLDDVLTTVAGVGGNIGRLFQSIKGYLAPVGAVFAGVAAVMLVAWSPLVFSVLGLIEAFQALGPAVSSAVATAAEVITAAWSAIDQTFGETFAGIVNAAGEYFGSLAETGASAIDWLAARFGELRDIATEAFGGIANALIAGEFALAGEIAWNALQLAFMKGAAAIATIWSEFATGLVSMFDGAIVAIRSTWSDVSTWIAEKLLTMVEMVRSFINKAAETMPLLFEGSAAQTMLNSFPDMAGAVEILKQDRDRFQKSIADAKQNRDAERADSMAQGLAETTANISALEAAQRALLDQAAAARNDATGGGSLLDNAREGLDELLAKNAAAIADATDAAADQKKIDEMNVATNQAADAASDRVAQFTGETQGTFSAAAATMLSAGGDTAAQRTAEATEKTAEAVEIIAENSDKPEVWSA